jgi:hypothetical protein
MAPMSLGSNILVGTTATDMVETIKESFQNTFFLRNLRMSPISYSVCPGHVFEA